MNNITDDFLKEFLKNAKDIVIVGASNKPERASNGIMKFLMGKGYNCYPVNPTEDEVLGVKAYKSIKDVPVTPDLVDVFRKSEACPEIVREAVEKGAKFIWLQEEVYSEEAKKIADENNIPIIMDKCIFKEFLRLKMVG
ncbi:MAG: CoA-binding protein [Deferribacterales bacterium]|uniref:CoA-binding protein n=1 Tax=Deferrivibrio essentukiensis TaxID=2880922 RepID=UPI0019B99E53|nr:CoA-binding protein [Deferrivibrio essentukiensis]MBC7196578.1 CoA-binding protein [Deferribacterales bacterium]MCB4203625.1 CoA-binding protein [Deferrivibrio essentukiensis]